MSQAELDKMLSHTVVRDAIPSEYFDYDCVQRLVADVRILVAEVARLTEERDEARAALTNIEDESDIYRDALLALIDAVHLYDRGMSTSDALSAALSRARVYAGEVTT